jgi:ribosomal protein S18 acetylase RimI-like enzyme
VSDPEGAAHTAPRYRIEPLDPEKHDRAGFSCGVAQVDNFFRRTANKLAKAGNLRVFVMVSPATASLGAVSSGGEVIGFYALNGHAISYTDLPKKYARTRPGHGSIPAAYLSMIAVDQRFAGQGFGGDLLADALLRCAKAAESIGLSAVVLDILDDGDAEAVERRKGLYRRYGFQPLVSQPLRMFLPMGTVRGMIRGDEKVV